MLEGFSSSASNRAPSTAVAALKKDLRAIFLLWSGQNYLGGVLKGAYHFRHVHEKMMMMMMMMMMMLKRVQKCRRNSAVEGCE